MHQDNATDVETGKLEIIEFYNGTKGDLDTLDD